jgi:hypothetical protein
MIKYRPQRGGLTEAMQEAKEFESVEEMFQYIVNKSKEDYDGVPAFDMSDLELHELHMDDNRIGWKNVGYVCTKRYMHEDYMEEYGHSCAIGHYGY